MKACLIAMPTVLLAACGSSVSVTTTSAASPSTSLAATIAPIDPTVTELREVAFAYWDAALTPFGHTVVPAAEALTAPSAVGIRQLG
jgi:hypothetical protein